MHGFPSQQASYVFWFLVLSIAYGILAMMSPIRIRRADNISGRMYVFIVGFFCGVGGFYCLLCWSCQYLPILVWLTIV